MARIYRKILEIHHIQPNAPVQIGDMHYTYDAAGNPTSILDTNGIGRDMIWDAENRLKEIIDTKEGLFHSYAYDHTGERILKRYGTAQNAYYNGKDMSTLHDFGDSYSAYASAYFVENNNGYTKHYYAGATRLVSKIGEDYYENNELVPTGKEEKKQYFYFQDHLGSSTYITDLNGDIAQYSAYTPYGEMFREYRNVTPYRFNGKELDTETGLYYYGARYYDPSTALWLGVDPLASKKPLTSPHIFCLGNPINLIDPNGEDEISINVKGDVINISKNNDYDKFHVLNNKGEVFASSSDFPYGTLEELNQITTENIDVINIRGDQNAQEIYEFLANNTTVEWSWFSMGVEGDKGFNTISTSHSRNKELSAGYLFDNKLKSYTIRQHTHNHPSGNNNPSTEDKSFYRQILKNKILKNNTTFKIYSEIDGYKTYEIPTK